MLDTWTAEARDLYERCHSREVQRFAAEFPPLTSDQRHALAVLLAPAPHHTDPAHAGRAATAC